jgi:hypothetical protein
LSERDTHTTGRLYDHAVATPYDPDNLLDTTRIWFEPAKLDPVQDCLGHAFNYVCRFPLFTDREQLFKLARLRGKKSIEYTVDRKMRAGYSPAMFNHFVVKGDKSYELVFLQAYSDTAD